MLIDVLIGRKNPDEVVTFIKAETKKFGMLRLLSFFDKHTPKPRPGNQQEVMICGVVPQRTEGGYFDYNKPPKHFIVRVPQPEDVRVYYDGFEIATSMCTTTTAGFPIAADEKRSFAQIARARAAKSSGDYISLITPGRLQSWLVTADNVNPPYDQPLIPGKGWVKRHEGRHVLVGVDSVAELDI